LFKGIKRELTYPSKPLYFNFPKLEEFEGGVVPLALEKKKNKLNC
jgi:hypothetical protein